MQTLRVLEGDGLFHPHWKHPDCLHPFMADNKVADVFSRPKKSFLFYAALSSNFLQHNNLEEMSTV